MEQTRSLGEAIRTRRLELGWSQEELAERIGDGVRQADVSRLERGRVTLPRRQRLERIAAALGMSPGELLARSGWAGADVAFAPPAAVDDRPEQVSQPVERLPVPPPASRPAVSPHLQTAIDRAHELQAWSSDVLRRSAATRERLKSPLPPGARTRDVTTNSGEDEPA